MSGLQKRHKLDFSTGMEHDDKLIETWRCPHMVDRRNCGHCFTAFELDTLVSAVYSTSTGNNKKRNRDDESSNNPTTTYQLEQYDGESKYND
jgi:hypothetical protein